MSAILVGTGALAVSDSCNSQGQCRVLDVSDEPPVQTDSLGHAAIRDFTTFMRAYQDMVFSTAYRLTSNEAQAEDISQEVFLKAHEHFDMLQESPTAGGWLKTVATNLSLNHLQRYRKRWRFFSEFRRDDAGDSEGDAPEIDFGAAETVRDSLAADDRRAWVERALARLPEHQRVPLVLFHYEDLPYDEIARRLGVSLAKVKTDILRARAALAKLLADSGTAHETFSL
ncbi:RNA polymerase sigma factor [Nibricoccus sp. IMCC34717]|uniref:RNA polymerase sigma factor n=1 Tax=Nibricoccus sp. IMCC34717 TaxID=3034021 RepID=UPI00385092DF